MVRSMTEALKVPLFHYHEDIDVGALLRARGTLQAGLPEGAPKITLLPFFIKALSHALREFPALNSRLQLGDGDVPRAVVHLGAHNVGVAMDTAGGLVVPVVKGVDRRSAFEVALELDRLRVLAQQGRLPAEDLEGGTITVSNIGALPLRWPWSSTVCGCWRSRAACRPRTSRGAPLPCPTSAPSAAPTPLPSRCPRRPLSWPWGAPRSSRGSGPQARWSVRPSCR